MPSPRTIAVFGASGDQGETQVRAALAAGHRVVAVGRKLARLQKLHGDRVELRIAAHEDPGATAEALVGADTVFVNLPTTSFQSSQPVIAAARIIGHAARAAGVGNMVFNAGMAVLDRPMGFRAQDARFEMRRALFESGVPTVSIQPVIYADNLLRAWSRPGIAAGFIRYPHLPDLEVSWICQDDVAALMLAAAERPDLAGRCFNVGGPEAIRGRDLARRLGRVLGRPMVYENQPVEDFCASLETIFQPQGAMDHERIAAELSRIYRWYNFGEERIFSVDMAPVLAELPVRLTSFEDWAMRQCWPQPAANAA